MQIGFLRHSAATSPNVKNIPCYERASSYRSTFCETCHGMSNDDGTAIPGLFKQTFRADDHFKANPNGFGCASRDFVKRVKVEPGNARI